MLSLEGGAASEEGGSLEVGASLEEGGSLEVGASLDDGGSLETGGSLLGELVSGAELVGTGFTVILKVAVQFL